MKILFSSRKYLLKNWNWIFPLMRYCTWNLEFVSNILGLIVTFFHISKVLEHVYITYRWEELRVKNTTWSICVLIRHFIVVFHLKNCVFFFIFISIFNKVSNFRTRILTNQKPEFGIKFFSGTVVNLFQKTYYLVHSLSALWKPYVFQVRIVLLKFLI